MIDNTIIIDDDECNEVETIDAEMATKTKSASEAGNGNTDLVDQVTISNLNNNISEVIEIDDSEEPDKTPSNVQPMRYNEMFKANKYLAKFVEKCLTLENSTGMLKIMNRTLFGLFVEADPEFKMSPKFDRLLVKIIKRLECDPDNKFSYIKSLCNTLKVHKLRRRVNLITLATNLNGNDSKDKIKSGSRGKRPSSSDRVKKKQKADVIDLDNEQETVINLEYEHVENYVILLEPEDENSNKENNALSHSCNTIENRFVSDEPTSDYNKVNDTNAIKESLPDHTDKTKTDGNFNRNLIISESVSKSSSQHRVSQLVPLEVEDPNTIKKGLPDPINKKKITLNFNRNVISESITNSNAEHMSHELVPVELEVPIPTKENIQDHTEKIMTVLNFNRNVISECNSNSNSKQMDNRKVPLQLEVPNAIEESSTNHTEKRSTVLNFNRNVISECNSNSNSQQMDNRKAPLQFKVPNAIEESLTNHTEKRSTVLIFNRNVISECNSNSNSQQMGNRKAPLQFEVPNAIEESLTNHTEKRSTVLKFNRNVISECNSNSNSQQMDNREVPLQYEVPNAIEESSTNHTEQRSTVSNLNSTETESNPNSQQYKVASRLHLSIPTAKKRKVKKAVSNVNSNLMLESSSNSRHIDHRLLPLELPKGCNTWSIENIEKAIARYKKVIAYLDEQEVFVNSYNSPYIQSERYRGIVVKLYKMLCNLTGKRAVERRQVHIQVPPGSPPGPARQLEKFLNDNIGEDGEPPFPDFADVLKCVNCANRVDNLGWSCVRVMNEAHSLFAKCGNALKKQRQDREWRDLMSHVNQELRDPADDDPELLAKLEMNKRLAKQKEEDVVKRFLQRENSEKFNSNIDIQVKVTRESDTSDDDDEDEDEGNEDLRKSDISDYDDEDEDEGNEDLRNTTHAISPDNSPARDVADLTDEDENEEKECKQKPKDISALLTDLGDDYTATIVDIEDPIPTLDISSDNDSDDEIELI